MTQAKLHLHHLLGCAPVPLAFYLKGLGILRIVAEQKDATARGWWADEHFCLLTTMDRAEIETFFLEDYAPTPFVSPWNKGSGFFQKDDPGLTPIESSTVERFSAYRRGIEAARAELEKLSAADAVVRALKERTKVRKDMTASASAAARALKKDPSFKAELAAADRVFAALKQDLFRPCQRRWRGQHRRWFDAAVFVGDREKPDFPSLLGTGGNDGRIDFTNNAMQRIGDLFEVDTGRSRAEAPALLQNALWREAVTGFVSAAVGQFLPGTAGGANATTGPDGDASVNPWDFLLMMEGAVLFTPRSTRRLDPTASSRASAPFAVYAHSVGHGTSGAEKAERGEQWMPLWGRPTGLSDLEALLGEGRLQQGRALARRPVDVARAVSRLGVARGIRRFVRFGFLERNGQSTFAVPLGAVDVVERPNAQLVADLAGWLGRLDRAARDKASPSRFQDAVHRLGDTVFALLTHDDSPDRWQAVLLAAVGIEEVQLGGAGYKAGPIPPLSPEWLGVSNDGSAEWRLACALGSAAARYQKGMPVDPVRHHWLPLERDGHRFRVSERRLDHDPRMVVGGRDPLTDFAALVTVRLIEAERKGERRLPIVAARGWEAEPADLAALIGGELDPGRISALARAFMAVRWDRYRHSRDRRALRGYWPDAGWAAVRLSCLPWPLDEHRTIPADPAVIRRLTVGDGAAAVELALRRLRSAGLRPPLQAACTPGGEAISRLWAAALAFPISQRAAQSLARAFQSATTEANLQEDR